MAGLNQRHIDGLKHLDDRREYGRMEQGLRLVLAKKPSKKKSWELTYYLHEQKRQYVFGYYPGDFTLAAAVRRQLTCPTS